jgi:ribosomal protein L2
VNHCSSVETDLDDIRTGEVMLLRDKPIGDLLTGWVVSGIEMARARSGLLCGTAGTWCCDVKGAGQEKKIEVQSTEAQARDGLTRISVEEPVMGLERRGRIVLLEHVST